jgi:transposase
MFNQSMRAASAIAPNADEAARVHELLAERDEQIARRDQTIAELRAQLESLQQQILALRRAHFGAKSERLVGQAELFCETVSVPLPPPATEGVSSYERERRGRPALPKHLPRRRIEYDLSDAEKSAFERVERIGEEVSETLDYTPARLLVIEHARAKYVCERAGESTIRIAAAQPSPLAKSNASAGLLAQVLVAKYADHIPLARQERIFARHGVALARTTDAVRMDPRLGRVARRTDRAAHRTCPGRAAAALRRHHGAAGRTRTRQNQNRPHVGISGGRQPPR